MLGYPTGLFIDATRGTPTDNNIPGSLLVQNTIIAGCPQPINYSIADNANMPTTPNTTATITTWFNTATYGISILTNTLDAGLTAPFNYLQPDFTPTSATAAAATGASFIHPKAANFFTQVSYKGACSVGDTWFKGWTKYM